MQVEGVFTAVNGAPLGTLGDLVAGFLSFEYNVPSASPVPAFRCALGLVHIIDRQHLNINIVTTFPVILGMPGSSAWLCLSHQVQVQGRIVSATG